MDTFNSERYFRELIRRNKIRDKLEQARLRRNNQYETEELYGKKNTPSLQSLIVRDSHDDQAVANQDNESSRSTFQDHDRISTSKDSGRGASSGESLSKYFDDNMHRTSPAKTMPRKKLKLRTDTYLPTAFNKLKERYKLEKEKQMELLETIRLLRGISKVDFYKELEDDSEDDVFIWEETVTLDADNANKTVDENDSQMERVLSPIANQIPTPERVPSPECLSLGANVSPDQQLSAASPFPLIGNRLPTPERVPYPECPSVMSNISPEQQLSAASLFPSIANQLPIHKEFPSDPQSSVMSPLPQLVTKTVPDKSTECKVDTRWPKGHKLFTQRLASDELSNIRFACYKRQHTLLHETKRGAAKRITVKKHEMKLNMPEHDTWRQTLLHIAYDKQWANVKKTSLNLFPFQRSVTLVSSDNSNHTKLNTRRAISSDDYVNFLLKRMNLS